MYLNLYVPKLAYPEGVVGFFRSTRGQPFASGAVMGPITKKFVASIHRFLKDNGLDLVDFKKGSGKTTSRSATWLATTTQRACSSSGAPRHLAFFTGSTTWVGVLA